MTIDERYQKAIAIFSEKNASALAAHHAAVATPRDAAARMMDHADLMAYETNRLFEKHAASLGYSMPYQYAWHMVAHDEEQLRDWQMAAMVKRGESLGFDYVAYNNITRDRLGYRYRGD